MRANRRQIANELDSHQLGVRVVAAVRAVVVAPFQHVQRPVRSEGDGGERCSAAAHANRRRQDVGRHPERVGGQLWRCLAPLALSVRKQRQLSPAPDIQCVSLWAAMCQVQTIRPVVRRHGFCLRGLRRIC